MKKLAIALTAVAAFTGPAPAADMAVRPPVSAAAPVAYAPSWTGLLRRRRWWLWPLEPGKYRLYRWSAARSVHQHNNGGRSRLFGDRGGRLRLSIWFRRPQPGRRRV